MKDTLLLTVLVIAGALLVLALLFGVALAVSAGIHLGWRLGA